MELLAFSIADTKAQLYMRPFFARSKGEAMRMFGDLCNESGHALNMHPEDYVLYYVGTFSEQTGALLGDTHESLCKGIDFVSASLNLEG